VKRTPQAAQRMAAIEPFRVMDVLARARELEAQGRSIVHMEVGEPDFPTPQPICDAGIAALRKGELHYTPALGLTGLREAIAGNYRRLHGIDVPASRIVVTTGSSGALLLALGALVDPGDQVLLSDPGYPCNRNFVRAVEGQPVGIPVGPDSHYQLTPELLSQHWGGHTCAAIVATPSNPTGTVVPAEQLRAMVELARERGGTLIVDEIYHGLVYEGETVSALTLGDDVFIVNSFSKYFNMTGWRLGWLVVPEDLLRPVEVLAQNLFISPPTLPQLAAEAAFECRAELDARVAAYRANRDLLLAELPKAGFRDFAPPDGAFYLYCDVGHMTNDSVEFCKRMLDEAGVAATPGTDFDRARGHRTLRFSFAGTREEMAEAARRLARWRGA
jgi:aspartate/methionine/tyrosine aminotransferase